MYISVKRNIIEFHTYEIILGERDAVFSIDKKHGTKYSNFFIIENKLQIDGDCDSIQFNLKPEICFELKKYKSIILCENDINKITAQEVFI